MTMIINGTSGVTFPNSTVQVSAPPTQYRSKLLSSGTTYTKPSDVVGLYVFVYGSTGGRINGSGYGAGGGTGYSETYYASPAASYSYSIGAGGAATPTAGGTTTFGAMSVTSSSAVASATVGAGGVGSGGTFNATGGSGGTSSASMFGGVGGAGSRAGNGGNGAAGGTNSLAGGGGGTGGNNASGNTGGAAGTLSGSAISLPFVAAGFEFFDAGVTATSTGSTPGASSVSRFSVSPSVLLLPPTSATYNTIQQTIVSQGNPSGAGASGAILIVEVLG